MQIAEFQRWTKDTDKDTQWDLITTLQLVSHLTEEIGEVAQSVNRIYGYAEKEERQRHQANLRLELVEAFWFLTKIANKLDVDLDTEVESSVKGANEWVGKHSSDLISSLWTLDREMSTAKKELNLKAPCVAAILLSAARTSSVESPIAADISSGVNRW